MVENKQQIKAQQAINSGALKQKNIVVNQVQDKHSKAYKIIFQQNNKVLDVDFDVIAKKVDDDLSLLLDDSTMVVFQPVLI
ncbi:hypothetical protein [Abyssogena phaseoliformis symbiont]|uniref:hypothetical protein n=1 Tax=Abyssogena phaseoliformis symbiont TaxID=596095 RepID=UPI001915BB51|nr:hypothetical protein [Abyssogena phaseoliformis symbiont]